MNRVKTPWWAGDLRVTPRIGLKELNKTAEECRCGAGALRLTIAGWRTTVEGCGERFRRGLVQGPWEMIPFCSPSSVAGCLLLAACAGCSERGATGGLGIPFSASVSTAADLDLAPAGVVEQQMAALGEWRNDPAASERVFSFASPGNQVITGPLERFEGLVESEPYLPLTNNQGYAVGRAVESGDAATVLVTLVDPSGALVAYRFYLSRQEDEPRRRWMTDAVYRFTPSEADAEESVLPTI